MFPIQINKGFIHLYNYEGLFFLTAILCGIIYFTVLLKMENISLDTMFEASFYSLLTALIIGSLFSRIFWSGPILLRDPLIIFKFWEGGISVTGGVIGGLVAGFIYLKIKKLHFFYHMRFVIPSIILGQIIGRFGCFLNGDAGGIPTKMPWGLIYYPTGAAYQPFTNIPSGTPLHPTQLYEIFGNIILLLFLILTGNNEWVTKRRIIWYALGYSLIRFIIEFYRSDKVGSILFFSNGQFICIFGMVAGLVLLIWSLFNDKKLDAKEENIARNKI